MSERHPDCPEVHLGACPKCRRLWKRDAEKRTDERNPEMDEPITEAPSVQALPDECAAGPDAEPAKALTPAEKQRAYRKRKGAEYRKRNAERMKAKRRMGKPKDSG